MIQRIQSLYLLGAGLLGIVRFIYGANQNIELNGLIIGFFIYEFAITTTSLVTIFLFKNRKLQMNICNLLLILFLFEIVLDTIIFHSYSNFITLIPILSTILLFLAFRAIKKDEEKVRSVDRLR